MPCGGAELLQALDSNSISTKRPSPLVPDWHRRSTWWSWRRPDGGSATAILHRAYRRNRVWHPTRLRKQDWPPMKLIIQVPCLNEAGTLAIALGALPRKV